MLIKSSRLIFFFVIFAFYNLWNLFWTKDTKIFLLFSSKGFIVLAFTFRSMILSSQFLGMMRFIFSLYGYPVILAQFVKRFSFLHQNALASCQKWIDYIFKGVFLNTSWFNWSTCVCLLQNHTVLFTVALE